MSCPICQHDTHRLFEKYGYWIRECQVCGHRCTEITPSESHTEEIYGDHYFQQGGAGYPDYLGEARLLTAHGKQYGRLLKNYTTPGLVLDVGAAAGFILKGLHESGWRGIGLEPNAHMAAYACTQLGLRIETGSLEDFEFDQRFDLITMIQVVAHFYNLRQAFEAAAAITRPSGFWLIETWNKDSLIARLLGENWHEYSPPSVLHWFSPQDLNHLARQFGFVEVARGRPSKWLIGAHIKSLLRYKLQDLQLERQANGLLKLIPDHFVFPYPAYDLFWILFQKL